MKTSTRIIFIVILNLFQLLTINAQDKTIDSLKLALKNAKHDTTRCKVLLQLAENASDEEWPKFNDKLKKLAETSIKSCQINSAVYKFYLKHIATSLSNTAFLELKKNQITQALQNYNTALKINSDIGDKFGIANCLINIGFIYDDQGNISKSLEYQSEALKVQEEIDDKYGIAESLNNIGLIYRNQGDNVKALECYERSLKIYEALKDDKGVAVSLNNIGLIYYAKNEFEKALDYYGRSLKIRELQGDKQGIANSLVSFGVIYYKQGNVLKALECYDKSLKIQEELNYKQGITYPLHYIGEIYLEQKNYSRALIYALRSQQISKELGYPMNIANASLQLSKIYKGLGNHKEAFQNYELYLQMRDSISNQETKKASIKSQFKIEYDRKEREARSEQEKKDLKNEEEKQKQSIIRNSFIAGFALTFVLAIVIFRSFLQNKKKNKLIEEQKHLVEEKQREIIDSIRYAQRIQKALMPSEKYFEKNLNKVHTKN